MHKKERIKKVIEPHFHTNIEKVDATTKNKNNTLHTIFLCDHHCPHAHAHLTLTHRDRHAPMQNRIT